MLTSEQITEVARCTLAHFQLSVWHSMETFRRDYHMRFKYILGLLCAVSISVVPISAMLAGNALAQEKTVKIGAIFPMSGNAASTGVHAKAALEVAMDIVNNAHPELGNFPLARNAWLAGLCCAQDDVGFCGIHGRAASGPEPGLQSH